jgi:hypothetical protein
VIPKLWPASIDSSHVVQWRFAQFLTKQAAIGQNERTEVAAATQTRAP